VSRPAAALKATKCACSQLTHTSALGFAQLCGRICVCVCKGQLSGWEDEKWGGVVGGEWAKRGWGLGRYNVSASHNLRAHTLTLKHT